MPSTSPMFNTSQVYKPFKYPWAMELAKDHEKIHWVEDEVTLEEDINDWKRNKLTAYEKEFVTQVLRLFTQSDVAVGSYYYDKFMPIFRNNELRNMLGSFAAREGVHQRAYALLNDSLGIPEGEYATFLEYAELRDKMEHMSGAPDNPTLPQIGTTLAKSVFNEGVSLFASFAMLLNFQRRGLMRGMGKVVEWSVRDESCFTGNTEILTETGWQRFSKLDRDVKIAQYSPDYGTISWAEPIKYIEKYFEGSLINFVNDKVGIDITATSDHDLLVRDHTMKYNMSRKIKMDAFTPKFTNKFICAGRTTSLGSAEMTYLEKFMVAINCLNPVDFKVEEGCVPGYKFLKFFVDGTTKVNNMHHILSNLDYKYTEVIHNKGVRADITVMCPVEALPTLEWVSLKDVSAEWCDQFMEEVYTWCDGGSIYDGEKCNYLTPRKGDVDVIQAICAIGGFKCMVYPARWPKRTCCLTIHKQDAISTANVEKIVIPYAGQVYCVTMPEGNIIVRQGSRVIVIGNCHVDGITKLFKAFIGEHREVVNDEFKKAIYDMATTTVGLEDCFIDLAYKDGTVEGLSADEVKLYIRHLTDRRLIQLGLKGIFKVKKNPMPWVEYILNGVSHDNFFEGKVVSYEIAGLTGSWGY